MLQSAPAGGPSARLYLDQIGAPVVARVTHQSRDHMTVRRALPFLKLHSTVHDEGGRRAEVSAVSVVIEDGTPQLVLELSYEKEEREPELEAQALAHEGKVDKSKVRRDATVPYVIERPTVELPSRSNRSTKPREATLQ